MPNTFEDASKATEEMFNKNEQIIPKDVVQEEIQEETEVQPLVEEETPETAGESAEVYDENAQASLEEATQTAEIAVQTAVQKDTQLQQVLQELEAVKQQNSMLQGTINELSKKNEQEIIEEAMELPILDFDSLAFADSDTQKQAMADYAAKLTEYNRNQIMKELLPFVEQAKEGLYEKEKRKTLSALAQVPELNGVESMMPQIEKIIANNKWLSSEDMPLDEKIINAFAIAKGVNSINTPPVEPKEPTVEELMELYNKNPDFQNMVEKQRLEQIKKSQQVPPFSASSGAVNAALNIKEKPKTFEEASMRTRQMFGLE